MEKIFSDLLLKGIIFCVILIFLINIGIIMIFKRPITENYGSNMTWFLTTIVPTIIIGALIVGIAASNIKEEISKLKTDLIKYEISQGRDPVIVKEDRSTMQMKSGERNIQVLIWSDPHSLEIKDYDNSTYFYGIHLARDLVIIGPEVIKKYGGKLPIYDNLLGKGEAEKINLPWKPSLMELITSIPAVAMPSLLIFIMGLSLALHLIIRKII